MLHFLQTNIPSLNSSVRNLLHFTQQIPIVLRFPIVHLYLWDQIVKKLWILREYRSFVIDYPPAATIPVNDPLDNTTTLEVGRVVIPVITGCMDSIVAITDVLTMQFLMRGIVTCQHSNRIPFCIFLSPNKVVDNLNPVSHRPSS
jgi:hypothetical protein